MSSSICESFLYDTCRIIKMEAEEARAVRNSLQARGEEANASSFQSGRAMAYFEVMSLLLHQAEVFGLDRTLLGLEGYDVGALLA